MSKWKLEVLTSPTPQTSPHSGSPQEGGGGGGAERKMNNSSTSISYHLFVYNLNKLYLAFLLNLMYRNKTLMERISTNIPPDQYQMRLSPVGQAPLLTIVTFPPDLQFACG